MAALALCLYEDLGTLWTGGMLLNRGGQENTINGSETETDEVIQGLEEDLKEDEEEWLKEECGVEDSIKVYSRDTYPREVFQALEGLRDCSLLTDLTLSIENGPSINAHFPVLAAVSSLVHQRLQARNDEERARRRRENESDSTDTQRQMSIGLGPEVGCVGLTGVLEFAYTGAIGALSRDTLGQIQAAAHALGVARVLDLCSEEEERMKNGGGGKKERKISVAEQMKASLQAIRQLWTERVGCDVELEADGTSFHVHRVVLAASSDYFRGMFTSGMRESQQPCVALPFLAASELEALIGCSYSGALHLSWGCVFEITCTALQLQFQPALSLCLNFLQQEMNVNSCLDVVSLAEAYGMVELLEVANDFVLRHFQEVAATTKFKDLSAKKLQDYLKSNSLLVPSELVVFKAVVAWTLANPDIKLSLVKELMETVHFTLMNFKDFKEVQALKIWTEPSMESLYTTICEDYCHTAPSSHCRVYFPKDTLVLVGGDQISADFRLLKSPSRELWFGNSFKSYTGIVKTVEWKLLGEMPESPRFSHEVAVMKGKLYIAGGRKYYNLSATLNSVYRYDPLQNSWQRLADMQQKRSTFSMVVLDGVIYAIGGDSDTDTYLDSVEHYCLDTDCWSFARPLDVTLGGHAAIVWNGEIFISGGCNCTYKCLVSMFLYHPERGTTYLADMNQPRANHCMERLGSHLYVAGGVTADANMATIDQLACEVYDPVADSWSALTSLPIPHISAASVVLEEKLYVLGGYCQEDYSESRLVHCYDPTTQCWENMGKIPGHSIEIRACVLHLPTHMRQ